VQEGLVGLDETGAVVPALAESWETPDANTYVFQLRDDATFHDGTPVTAEDVVFSLQAAQDETLSPSLSWYLANMASAEVTGENEVTVTTAEPDQAFIKNLTTAGSAFVTSQAH
jgi:ABC-type transport system substrate-binding protein